MIMLVVGASKSYLMSAAHYSKLLAQDLAGRIKGG